MKEEKKFLLLKVLTLMKEGLTPSKIGEKLKLPKQNINYYVGKLKKWGCVEKKGYGVWEYKKDLKEVKIRPIGSKGSQVFTSKKEIRGHAFIWKIDFFGNPPEWDKIVKTYKKKKLKFQFFSDRKIIRFIYNNRKVWLSRQGIIIYEPLDFVGKSSFEVKGTAVYEMDKLVKGIFKELNIKLRKYRFTTSREHYGMIKNELARQYNERKEKLFIKSEQGTVWLWIDDSKGLSELETNDPNISRQVQNYWNDHKKHKFKATPSLLLDSINRNANHLEYHAENMRSHVGATKDLSVASKNLVTGTQELTSEIKKITEVLEKLDHKLK